MIHKIHHQRIPIRSQGDFLEVLINSLGPELFRARRVEPSVFLFQRTIGDLVVVATTLLIGVLSLLPPRALSVSAGTFIAYCMDLGYVTGLLSAAVATSGLSCLKTMAVMAPLWYKTRVTWRHCFCIVCVNWAFCAIVAIGIASETPTCRQSVLLESGALCLAPRLLFVITVLVAYCIVPISVVTMALALRLSRLRQVGNGNCHVAAQGIKAVNLWAGALNFFLGYFPLVVQHCLFIGLLVHDWSDGRVQCHTIRHFSLLVVAKCAQYYTIVLKSLADPLIDFVIDRRIRDLALG